jgi:hypothetical protein
MYQITVKDKTFKVDAQSKNEAINAVADYIHIFNMHDYFKVAADFASDCDLGDDVDSYAKSEGFYRYGTHGIYIPVTSAREVAR